MSCIVQLWKKCCMKCGVWNQMKILSSHLLDNLSLNCPAQTNYHRERFRKLTFRALALRRSETKQGGDWRTASANTYETQNKTTQMRTNQSRAILIFPIPPTTTWLFAGYPYTTGTQKAAKISNKNSFFSWVHSLHTESTNASHSTNLFTISCNHISTNGKALLHSHINHNNPQFLYSLWRRANARNISFINLSRW